MLVYRRVTLFFLKHVFGRLEALPKNVHPTHPAGVNGKELELKCRFDPWVETFRGSPLSICQSTWCFFVLKSLLLFLRVPRCLMNFHYSLAKGCRNTELFWKLINSRPSAGEARLAPKFGRTFLRVTKSDPLSRRARKKGRETTTGCFHRRILAVQLPPCLWENWRWLVRPVPLVVATFSSVLVWLLGNIGKVMSCFFFLFFLGV